MKASRGDLKADPRGVKGTSSVAWRAASTADGTDGRRVASRLETALGEDSGGEEGRWVAGFGLVDVKGRRWADMMAWPSDVRKARQRDAKKVCERETRRVDRKGS